MVNWASLKTEKDFSLNELKDLLVMLHHYKEFVLNEKYSSNYIDFHLKILEENYAINPEKPDLSHCFCVNNSEPVDTSKSYLYKFDKEMKIAKQTLMELQFMDSRFNDFETQINYEY
jgi:hypothetical protein